MHKKLTEKEFDTVTVKEPELEDVMLKQEYYRFCIQRLGWTPEVDLTSRFDGSNSLCPAY